MREMKGEGPKKSLEQQRYMRAIFIYGLVALPLPRPVRPYAAAAAREGAGVESNSASALKHPSSRQSEV